MGGKEASRGFLYQGFASVLEALTDKSKWDKIFIEFPTSNDKVDIALEQQNKIVKCIQVKSTINTFSKADIVTWLGDLIKDIESPEYELFLIGQCDKSANTFIKSIEKYYGKMLDKEAISSLNGFGTDLLDNKQIRFCILPFEIGVLEKIVRDSLHQYISYSNQMITFDQISFIASATVNDQMISSTNGKGINRKDFDEELEKRILLVADNYSPERISIGIKSFTRGSDKLEESTKSCLSLIDKFNDRDINDGYDWNQDIYNNLKEFLLENTNNKQAYQLFLDTHSSIAFAAGRILDSKAGINIFPIQKTATNGTILWDVKLSSKKNYPDWDVFHERLNENQYDSALILNVTRNIYDEVIQYMDEKNLSIGRITSCTPSTNGATNFSIEDGTHATILANSVYNAVARRSIVERRATLHIFAAAPNAFMFFLGQNSIGFGKCILYEYDFEQRSSCSYSPSINFIN
ncbi:SAVED domain-containing protein [Desulfitobacterium hafniense]|uniref:SMODS-associated and fused to various effectors domain-containing protein n=3 Tax=Desulfitobacterium hafniense TaxID=49338 RepID=Q24ZR0_DESHY|nr:SAVED domain-containing protein [Desulfitobacterium hafniense]EHL05446.1 hypothetical protein HMPREF0322_03876 [Desulfitobacterium hafniense DP7]KTE89083.1 hypothetical protein AT727_13740 [Desulfitobacterium hafniense]BAE82482.1 hypothetical protein DSY0693 [Desulfitobacterium hafniense Y51]